MGEPDVTGGQIAASEVHYPPCCAMEPESDVRIRICTCGLAFRALRAERDQARSIAVRLEQESAALTEALRAVTHEYRPLVYDRALAQALGQPDSGTCQIGGALCDCKCLCGPTHPVHRTPKVIAAELDAAAEVRRG